MTSSCRPASPGLVCTAALVVCLVSCTALAAGAGVAAPSVPGAPAEKAEPFKLGNEVGHECHAATVAFVDALNAAEEAGARLEPATGEGEQPAKAARWVVAHPLKGSTPRLTKSLSDLREARSSCIAHLGRLYLGEVERLKRRFEALDARPPSAEALRELLDGPAVLSGQSTPYQVRIGPVYRAVSSSRNEHLLERALAELRALREELRTERETQAELSKQREGRVTELEQRFGSGIGWMSLFGFMALTAFASIAAFIGSRSRAGQLQQLSLESKRQREAFEEHWRASVSALRHLELGQRELVRSVHAGFSRAELLSQPAPGAGPDAVPEHAAPSDPVTEVDPPETVTSDLADPARPGMAASPRGTTAAEPVGAPDATAEEPRPAVLSGPALSKVVSTFNQLAAADSLHEFLPRVEDAMHAVEAREQAGNGAAARIVEGGSERPSRSKLDFAFLRTGDQAGVLLPGPLFFANRLDYGGMPGLRRALRGFFETRPGRSFAVRRPAEVRYVHDGGRIEVTSRGLLELGDR